MSKLLSCFQQEATMDAILAIIAAMGHEKDIDLATFKQSPLYQQIVTKLIKKQKLTFILPAFPAKSSNRNKTYSSMPDLGELVALKRLQKMCEEINALYAPHSEVIICSDGRVFNDLVFVSDHELAAYDQKIKIMIHDFKLTNLKTYSLDDFYQENAKEQLLNNFAPPLESIKEMVKNDASTLHMFNGVHRFIKDDLSFNATFISKNRLHKQSKEIAYQVIQRSRAWDNLLAHVFSQTLRLSIHPYPLTHHKFGIELVRGQDRWATPWHNVVLKIKDSYQLVKRIEALRQGA